MFLKPFKIKSQSLVKKSDKKKLQEQLLQGNISRDVLDDLLPLKGDLGVTRLITHSSGEVLVYTNKKTPYFFTFQNLLIPTVYALWKCPGFVPNFTTHKFVFSRLQNGADLMLPGVMIPKAGFLNFNRDQACSINVSSNMAAVSVGLTDISCEKIVKEGVKSGRLVMVLHNYGDLLWKMGDNSALPNIPGEEFEEDEEEEEDETKKENACDEVEEVTVKLPASLNTNVYEEKVEVLERKNEDDNDNVRENECGDDDVSEDGDDTEEGTRELYQHESIPESMDDLLRFCFMFAVKKYSKAFSFPILTNLFYKNFMIPCCPKDHPLHVKKSSYKKLSTFLASLQSEGLLVLEQVSRGVEAIGSIDLHHCSFRDFQVPEWELNTVKRKEEDDNDEEDWLNYEPPQFTSAFLVTTPLLAILNTGAARFCKGDVITTGELRDAVTCYVKENCLQEGRFVKLDVVLSHSLLSKNDHTEVMSWSDLMDALCSRLTRAHLLQQPGKPTEVLKGDLQKIKFDVKQKASNKKVTELWNLQAYGINVRKLACHTQKSLSCNAYTSGDKSLVLHVAGNQIAFLQKVLNEKYRLPLKYMTGLEKAVKKKGKK